MRPRNREGGGGGKREIIAPKLSRDLPQEAVILLFFKAPETRNNCPRTQVMAVPVGSGTREVANHIIATYTSPPPEVLGMVGWQ